MGYVYLLHAVGTDRYKIGRTKSSVQKRVKSLQTGCANKLRIVAILVDKNERTLEQRLHHRFRQFRRHGEWFTFNSSTPGIYETFGVELQKGLYK